MKNYSSEKSRYIFLKVCLALMIISVLCVAGLKIYDWQNKINDDAILSQSVFKDKKFQAKVQNLKTDALSTYLFEDHSNPIISISFLFRNSGRAHEAEDKEGLTTILADMLLQGTKKYSSEKFKQLSEEYGIKIGYSTTKDDFSGSLIFPKVNQQTAINLFKETLLSPSFEEEYLNISKQQILTALQISNEKPQAIISNKFAEFMYGGHPYSRQNIGQAEHIKNITSDDLHQFMKDNFAKDNLIIGIAGDITSQDATQLLNKLFSDISEKSSGQDLLPLEVISSGESMHIEGNNPQTITYFAARGTYRNSIDFYPLYIANYIFGESGLSSRLNQNIRERQGLTYGIYTSLSINDASALIFGTYSATYENNLTAKKTLLDEWNKIAIHGVTEKELQQAKDSLIASYNLRFASTLAIADMLVSMQKYKLGADFLDKRNDYIKAVTLQEVNAAARKYFSTQPDFVSIGAVTKEEN